MRRGLKALRPLIANMVLFINKIVSLSEIFIYIVTFSVAHWDT